MTRSRHILIDGKQHRWKDILELRRTEQAAVVITAQLVLFEALHDDRRPAEDRTASGRYQQPGLFETGV